MRIEDSKEHIKHALKIKSRKEQVKVMKEFWEWLANMTEAQRRTYILDLFKAEHLWPDPSQKEEIRSLRRESLAGLTDETRAIIERSLENLHEETHIETEEPME